MEIINFNPAQESEEQYIYRICSLKESSGMTWQQVADIINAALDQNYGESAYRKKYQMFQHGLKTCEKQVFTDDEYLKKIQAEREELYKVKKQFQDQRREYNKLLASDARAEHLTEKLIEAAENLSKDKFLSANQILHVGSKEEAVLVLTDWHFGMVTDNIWNKYDTNECLARVNTLFKKASEYLKLHSIRTLHIVLLGDFIHGSIHTSARVASEEDTCDQLMEVSEILAELINGLSQNVNDVYVYSTYGNHARTVQNKNDSIHSDNMEKVIPWWIKQRLAKNYKVHVRDNNINEFIFFNVLGHDIVAVHGDLERFSKLGVDMHTLFGKKYGLDVEYVFSGDKHHSETIDSYGIDNVMVSSLCGTDDYANNKRLYANPAQTLCIFNKEDGKICTYNIKL